MGPAKLDDRELGYIDLFFFFLLSLSSVFFLPSSFFLRSSWAILAPSWASLAPSCLALHWIAWHCIHAYITLHYVTLHYITKSPPSFKVSPKPPKVFPKSPESLPKASQSLSNVTSFPFPLYLNSPSHFLYILIWPPEASQSLPEAPQSQKT